MKYKSLFIAIIVSFFPLGGVSANRENFHSKINDVDINYDNTISQNHREKKIAQEYLDQAKNIIIDDYTPLLSKNKKEREEFIRLVNKSLETNETARGYLYLGHAGFMAFNSHGNKKAVENYEKAIELNPEYVEAFIALGSLHKNNQNAEGVITNYGEAIRLDSDNDVLYGEIGIAKQDIGDHKGAIIDLEKAMKVNPHNALTYFHSGQSKHFLGDFKGAGNDFSKAIELNPESANYYFFRAFAYLDQNDIRNGCQDLENASKLGANSTKQIKKYCKI